MRRLGPIGAVVFFVSSGCNSGGTYYVGAEHDADLGAAGAEAGTLGCPLVGGERRYMTLSAGGVERRFFLSVPSKYDASRAYPIVFGFHGRDGSGAGAREDLGVQQAASPGSAVFVYPDALVRQWSAEDVGAGWQNGPSTNFYGGSEDLEFVRELVAYLETGLCLRASQRFAVGRGWGGEFAAVLGCYAADLFDAVVSVHANAPYYLPAASDDEPRCNGAVAAWTLHGRGDSDYPLEFGLFQRDFWLVQNGCTSETTVLSFAGMASDDECVEYACSGPRTRFCAYSAALGRGMPEYVPGAVVEFLLEIAAGLPRS